MSGLPSGRGGAGQVRGRPPAFCLPVPPSASRFSEGSRGPPGPHEGVEGSGRHRGVQLIPGAPSQWRSLWPRCFWPVLRTEQRPRSGVLSAVWRLPHPHRAGSHLECMALGSRAPVLGAGGIHGRKKAPTGRTLPFWAWGKEEEKVARDEQWPCDDRQEAGRVAGVEGGWGAPRPRALCDRKPGSPLECDGKPRRVLSRGWQSLICVLGPLTGTK